MTDRSARISTSVSPELAQRVEGEALDLSEVGNRVTVSDVIRQALYEHFGEEPPQE